MTDVERLTSLYARAAARIQTALTAVDPGKYSADAAGQAMLKTMATVKALNEAAAAWADEAIDRAWAQGARTAKTGLEILGKKPVKPARTDPRQALKDTLAETLIKANGSINEMAGSFLALTAMGAKTIAGAELQEFDPEGIRDHMTELATQAVKNESSRKVLAGQIRNSLSSEISAGNLININGKAWRADRYAEMVARTTLREAQTEATLELCRQYENDLVQWSNHGTICMACHEYEGNIYSISGKHPTYPPLTESPPLHPNCEHSLLPTTDIALDLRKAGPGKAGWLDGAAWLSPAGQAALKKAAAPKPARKAPVRKPPTGEVKWRPSMTPEEADLWAKDSVVKDIVHHNTDSAQAVEAILKTGFLPGDGAAYSRGIYGSTVEEVAYGRYNLQTRINVKNPMLYHTGTWNEAEAWYFRTFNRTWEQAGLLPEDGLAKYVTGTGHDALRVNWRRGDFGPGTAERAWYVIYDKKNMTIIKNINRGGY